MMNRLLLATMIFVSMLAGTSAIAAATPETLAEVSKEVPNFHSFGTGLYRGGRPTVEGLMALRALGVKTIIDLQGGDAKDPKYGVIAGAIETGEDPQWIRFERKISRQMGMKFINLPLNSLSPIDDEATGKAIGSLLGVINDPKNQPVFVHCEHGKDRTGLIVALYRVYFQHWSKEKAHQEMLDLGHSTFWTSDMDDFFYAVTKDKP
jgi:protein tyrosine/serine phosphatase